MSTLLAVVEKALTAPSVSGFRRRRCFSRGRLGRAVAKRCRPFVSSEALESSGGDCRQRVCGGFPAYKT